MSEILNLVEIHKKKVLDLSIVSAFRYDVESVPEGLYHISNTAAVFYIEVGQLCLRIDDFSTILAPGLIFYLPPGSVYSATIIGKHVIGWCLFIPNCRYKNLPLEIRHIHSTILLLALSNEIISWGIITKAEKTFEQSRLVDVFIDQLIKSKSTKDLIIRFPKQSNLQYITDHIVRNPADTNDIDHWAGIAKMSRRSFTTRFALETGLPFAAWRRRVKLQSALGSLLKGNHTKEVALDLGFGSTSAFIESFRREFGMPPKRYIATLTEHS